MIFYIAISTTAEELMEELPDKPLFSAFISISSTVILVYN